MKSQFFTDPGKVRGHNEDSGAIINNENGEWLAIIADGMGGHQAGDVASELAVSIMKEKWHERTEAFENPEQTEQWLTKSLKEVNRIIYDKAQTDPSYSGMGTTVVATVLASDFLTVAHIGDSRCYIYNENGLHQITEDHSLVNELVKSGEISKEDAKYHPRKNIVLKALGTEYNVSPEVTSLGWEIKDKLLLCTDGLTDKITNEELADQMSSEDDLNQIGESLIALANDRGGEDNISLIIIHYLPSGNVGDTSC